MPALLNTLLRVWTRLMCTVKERANGTVRDMYVTSVGGHVDWYRVHSRVLAHFLIPFRSF
jgi:hypothetical protein